jgi:hypothetical protein
MALNRELGFGLALTTKSDEVRTRPVHFRDLLSAVLEVDSAFFGQFSRRIFGALGTV